MCALTYVCVCGCKHTWGVQRTTSGVRPCLLSPCLSQGLFVSLLLPIVALKLRICTECLAFMCCLGIRTQVLTLVQQALSTHRVISPV